MNVRLLNAFDWLTKLETQLRNWQTCAFLFRSFKEKDTRKSFYFQSGYYPTSETVEYTEEAPPQPDNSFFAKLCCDWEESAALPSDHPSRHVILRIGLVLGRDGGAVKSMVWPFWFGVGGRKVTKPRVD